MKYYINGKQVTKEEYQKQKKTNDRILNMPFNTAENREKWLKDMQKAGFLTRI